MKVVYDHSAFNQRFGGVSRYFCELVKRLASKEIELEIRVYISRNIYVSSVRDLWVRIPAFKVRGLPRLEQFVGDVLLAFSLLFDRQIDIYHATHYSCFMFKLLPKKTKTITTVYDMNEWVIPDFYPENSRRRIKQSIIMEKADALIAISENTRNDIIRFFPEYRSKVFVATLGVDKSSVSRSTPMKTRFERFILFVGARNSYKNFNIVVQALASFGESLKDVGLIVAGDPFTDSELEYLSDSGCLGKVENVAPSDESLMWLYRNAILFVYPSFYEGFGLPLLEAMVSGCPVVASNVPVFKEVCQDAAIYFDPSDPRQLTLAIEELSADESMREKLLQKGSGRLAEYTWEKCADAHFRIYKDLLGSNGRYN